MPSSIAAQLRSIADKLPQGSLPQLRSALIDGIKRIDEPMQLAVIGKISSSKSTLINAILGKREVMATGQLEVTYNVGWLKYGNPNKGITLHFKNGRPPQRKSQEDFKHWATEGPSGQINDISYIELYDDAEILKQVNIIDTPGLSSIKGRDSQNTIDFITRVRPDAVIMLFTNSVSAEILDVVKKFNAGTYFTPLNAVGVLGKIDQLWVSSKDRSRNAIEIAQSIRQQLLSMPIVADTLLDIYPISALQALASSTLTLNQIEDIRLLAQSDPSALQQAIASPRAFVKKDLAGLMLGVPKREELLKELGLYGICCALTLLKAHPEADTEMFKEHLWNQSGAHMFIKVLHNHFGQRARLIKMESIYQQIRQQIQLARSQASSRSIVNSIEQSVEDAFVDMVDEHNEYLLLNQIYNHELELATDIKKEFLHLAGEHGTSAPDLLGINNDAPTVKQMITLAGEREKYWRTRIVCCPDPDEIRWMEIIRLAYTRLRLKLQTMRFEYERARAFLFKG